MALLVLINPSVGFWYLTNSRILQGFGLGFLFVPITVAAYTRITPKDMGQATGLFNLLRNEGGSVGIALSATVLARRAQFHQLHLTEHISAFDHRVTQALSGIAHGLFPRAGVDPVTMKHMAEGLLYGQVQRQSYFLAFADVFWMLMLIFFCLIPFVFLLKGKAGKKLDPLPEESA